MISTTQELTTVRLPIEDPEGGLYIHRLRPDGLGTRVLVCAVDESETSYWVDASQFMAMQKERDDYRRTLALINAERGLPSRVLRLLDNAGFTAGDAEAMRGLIAEVTAGG